LRKVYVKTDPQITFENPYVKYGASDNDEVARMRILDSFYHAVVEDTPPQYGVEEGMVDQMICLAVKESSLRGNRWISLPLQEETEIERLMHEEYVNLYGCKPEDIYELIKVPFPRGGVRWRVAQWL